jgi:hypothetical protein
MTDLTALLTDPTSVPIEEIPAVIGQLEQAKAVLWARLTVPNPACRGPNGHTIDDVVPDVHEVARIVRRSVSWVRKHGHTLPGFLQPGGKGTRVGWSRRSLETWAAGGC